MKVLIIDDSPDARAIAEARLKKEGLEIFGAPDGDAGLKSAAVHKPDLILLDVDMPGMSGFDVCCAVKADPELCMIPVIFLTGSCSDKDKVKGLDLGAVDYITKPFDEFELRARVRAALRTKRLQDLLVEHAQRDPLTELRNHRALMDRLRREWSRICRTGGSLAFIMADLDKFKSINDRHGHPVGDRVLRAVAAAIAHQCRESDTPARYGGEEFAILCPDVTAKGALVLAERCRRAIEDIRIELARVDIRTTASLGVADSRTARSPEGVVTQADDALYQAKQLGRNRVVAHGDLPEPTQLRSKVASRVGAVSSGGGGLRPVSRPNEAGE